MEQTWTNERITGLSSGDKRRVFTEVLTNMVGKENFEITHLNTLHVSFVVRYPEITMKNEKGYHAKALEVYILVTISFQASGAVSFMGTCMEPTAYQYYKRTFHPHGGGVLGDFSTFCTGSGPLHEFYIARRSDLVLAMLSIKAYLEFENNNERNHLPAYSKTIPVPDEVAFNDPSYLLRSVAREAKRYFDISIQGEGLVATPREDLEYALGEVLGKLRARCPLIAMKLANGTYVTIGANDTPLTDSYQTHFYFQNKPVLGKVRPMDGAETRWVAHPMVTKQVTELFTQELNRQFLEKFPVFHHNVKIKQ